MSDKERLKSLLGLVQVSEVLHQKYWNQLNESNKSVTFKAWAERCYPAAVKMMLERKDAYHEMLMRAMELPCLPHTQLASYALLEDDLCSKLQEEMIEGIAPNQPEEKRIFLAKEMLINQRCAAILFRWIEVRAMLDGLAVEIRKDIIKSKDLFLPFFPATDLVHAIAEQHPKLRGASPSHAGANPSKMPIEVDPIGLIKRIFITRLELVECVTSWQEELQERVNRGEIWVADAHPKLATIDNLQMVCDLLKHEVLGNVIWLKSDILMRQLGFDYNDERETYIFMSAQSRAYFENQKFFL